MSELVSSLALLCYTFIRIERKGQLLMNNNEQELAEFWDEFAEEYEEIQQESPFPIARELRDFLVQEGIFPCQTFLDIAGGRDDTYLFSRASHGVYASRYSQRMLEIAEAKAQKQRCFSSPKPRKTD